MAFLLITQSSYLLQLLEYLINNLLLPYHPVEFLFNRSNTERRIFRKKDCLMRFTIRNPVSGNTL